MREKLVAGNWKMNGGLAENAQLLEAVIAGVAGLQGVQRAVCVPFPYLHQAQRSLQGTPVAWGAENVSQYEKGAYTGEVSAAMLLDFGCRYAIVGHSERRALFGEGDGAVADKFSAAQAAGLVPVLCVGETLEEREASVTEAVVSRQLDAVIARCGVESLAKAVVAYEPVWAIGTGKVPTLEDIAEVHDFMRAELAKSHPDTAEDMRLLYGGSVKPSNAAEIFAVSNVDGGLVGGASLKAADFGGIVKAASEG
ncbi:MAG TPA: triose-phosphate isomerase [Betaproteobacteria bacterium]|nr:triose-phosphate isomerase [Betaproteobacteria bacterium]